MTKIEIVTGEVVSKTEDGVMVLVWKWKHPVLCPRNNLTDFSENIDTLSNIGSVKKFCISNKKGINDSILLSYKYIHPEEQSKKTNIIPTASHCKNIHKQLNKSLKDAEASNYTIEPIIPSFNSLL